MVEKINVNFRADAEKVAELDAIAKAQDRDRSYILNEAVEHYLAALEAKREYRAFINEEIKKAVAEADAGNFITDEEFAKEYENWFKDDPLDR